MVLFRRRAKGLDTTSTNSVKIWGCISSGPHDLFTFNFNVSLRIISSLIFILGRFTSVFLSRTGTSASGCFVKTLRNCFWSIFSFSLQSNFVTFHLFYSVKEVPCRFWFYVYYEHVARTFLDYFPTEYHQYFIRTLFLIAFLALVYACRRLSASETFKTFFDDIHCLCSLLLFRIASRRTWLNGTLFSVICFLVIF